MDETADQDLTKELNRQMRSLARRSRTTEEIRQRLAAKDYAAEQIEEMVTALRRFGFLDDERYAGEYVRARSRLGYGEFRIRQELDNKGCPEKATNEAIREFAGEQTQEELLQQVIERRIRIKGEPHDQKTLKQLLDFCTRRGFDQELIRAKLAKWFDLVMG